MVWVLALGSDAQSQDLLEGNADAIELVALDPETGAAVALGIPRDPWSTSTARTGEDQPALLEGGPGLVARRSSS